MPIPIGLHVIIVFCVVVVGISAQVVLENRCVVVIKIVVGVGHVVTPVSDSITPSPKISRGKINQSKNLWRLSVYVRDYHPSPKWVGFS
jgi:hypothetical protein